LPIAGTHLALTGAGASHPNYTGKRNLYVNGIYQLRQVDARQRGKELRLPGFCTAEVILRTAQNKLTEGWGVLKPILRKESLSLLLVRVFAE
jgi:hypothetical protein